MIDIVELQNKLEDHTLIFNNELISLGTLEGTTAIRYENGCMIMSTEFIIGIDKDYAKKEKTD